LNQNNTGIIIKSIEIIPEIILSVKSEVTQAQLIQYCGERKNSIFHGLCRSSPAGIATRKNILTKYAIKGFDPFALVNNRRRKIWTDCNENRVHT